MRPNFCTPTTNIMSQDQNALQYLNNLKNAETTALESFEHYAGFPERAAKPKEHFCDKCKADYKEFNDQQRAMDRKWKDVFPKCKGSLENMEMSKEDWLSMGGSEEEYEVLEIEKDPVKWAAAELGFITEGIDYDREGDQISMDRWYQSNMLRCSAQLKVYRCGRRIGKSETMAVEVLEALQNNEDEFTVILVAPFETQLMKFEEKLLYWLERSTMMKDNFDKYNKTKHIMTFKNGARYEGYCTGGDKQSKTADRVRGAGASLLVLDEADYISEDCLQAVLAVMSDDPKCKILLSSTPSGKRGFFYDWCVDKTVGFKEFHVYSHASPSYTKVADNLYRKTLSEDKYKKEYLGDFGTLVQALIRPEDINKATEPYDMMEYRNRGPQKGWAYIVGIDWNGRKIGTNIVVIGFEAKTGKYKMVDKVVVRDNEYNYESSCWAAIKTFDHWKAQYMYVDAGHGDMQGEMIKKTAKQQNNMKLMNGFVEVAMGGFQTIKDPVTQQDVKKSTKEFAINLMVNAFEQGRITIPYSENYKEDDEDWGIIPQLYDLAIEDYSETGKPKYAKTVDHTLTAMYVAILGFHMKMTDLGKLDYDNFAEVVSQGDLKKLAGGIEIAGMDQREKERRRNNAVIPGQFVARSNMSRNPGQSGPNYGAHTTVNEADIEWKNGVPHYKHDTGIASVPTRNLGLMQRGSF